MPTNLSYTANITKINYFAILCQKATDKDQMQGCR